MFSKQDLFDDHLKDYKGIGTKPQRSEMPANGKNILQFQNYHKKMCAPFVIYGDFECFNIPVEGPACDPKHSNTRMIASQVPCSFCYIVVRSDGVSGAPVL